MNVTDVTEPDGDRLLRNLQAFRTPLARVSGVGIALPERVVTNEDVAATVDAPARSSGASPGSSTR